MRAVYSASKIIVTDDNLELGFLYLLEDPDNGYILVFCYKEEKKEKLISDCKIFDKKTRKKIVNKITLNDINEIIFINLLKEEKEDFLDKLKGNY